MEPTHEHQESTRDWVCIDSKPVQADSGSDAVTLEQLYVLLTQVQRDVAALKSKLDDVSTLNISSHEQNVRVSNMMVRKQRAFPFNKHLSNMTRDSSNQKWFD